MTDTIDVMAAKINSNTKVAMDEMDFLRQQLRVVDLELNSTNYMFQNILDEICENTVGNFFCIKTFNSRVFKQFLSK